MEFRSTLCSQYHDGNLPEWFKKKYKETILFPRGLLVVSKKEAKYYSNDFFEYYQKAVKETGFWDSYDRDITIAVIGDDGEITQVVISNSEINYYCALHIARMKDIWYPKKTVTN